MLKAESRLDVMIRAVIYEWDARRATSNLRQRRVSFSEAASVFLDPVAITFEDPDHSEAEDREITIGISDRGRILFVSIARGATGFGSSAGEKLLGGRKSNMQKAAESSKDELRPEYDLAELGGGVRGKYYRQAKAGTNLVLIEPDLAETFPDEASVNRALRLLVSTAKAATRRERQNKVSPRRRPGRLAR